MSTATTADQPETAGTAPASAATDQITRLRSRIDEIDRTLIALWQERAEISQRVGAARVAAGGTRLALAREQEILDQFHRTLGPIGTELALLLLRAGRGRL